MEGPGGYQLVGRTVPIWHDADDPPWRLRHFDELRVEWERAAWRHAGDRAGEERAKRALIRSQMFALVARLTDDLAAAFQAVAAQPEVPSVRAALGSLLVRLGRSADAIEPGHWPSAALHPCDATVDLRRFGRSRSRQAT